MKTTYNYNTVLTWDPRDEIWVARVPELPGCMAHGDTQQEALEELQNAIPGWIEAAQDAETSRQDEPSHRLRSMVNGKW